MQRLYQSISLACILKILDTPSAMGSTARLAFGVMGNATSLLLYAAPILTFIRVMRKKSTEEFSCTPYIIALLNCALYTWYGLPVVSNKWENLLLVTTNGTGMLLETSFVLIYLQFTSTKGKFHPNSRIGAVAGVVFYDTNSFDFFITAMISGCLLSDHHQRKVVVGSVALATSIAMYGSPLLIVKHVVETKSVEFMPFYLSLFSFLASSSWLAYGLAGHDLFVAAPNIVGTPLGLIQLVLYFAYKRKEESTTVLTTIA